jgi:leucyl-tRNA synthetase
MTLAPEHPLVQKYNSRKGKVNDYIEKLQTFERERMADVKTISGYLLSAEHPFTKEPIPVWIGDYV